MTWTKNKTLLEYSKYTPCQEIFQAVCDELGNYYERRGFKYSKTKREISVHDEKLKLEVCFWSSRSNIPGSSINLEIIPAFFSTQFKNADSNGFMLGHTDLFRHSNPGRPNNIITIRQIYGDEIERIDESGTESLLIENHHCNVYDISEAKFERILKFIDTKILYWLDRLKSEEGIDELVEKMTSWNRKELIESEAASNFMQYVKLNFPSFDILKRLGK